MLRPFSILLVLLLVARGALAYEGASRTQDEPAPVEPPKAPVLTRPPSVKTFVQAEYPPEALAERRGAEVGLVIDISADGRVERAEVVRSAGAAFDEAARAALLRFEFVPAEIDGKPALVRLEYVYRFEPPPPPVEVKPAELPVNLRGRVLERGTREPLAGLSVWLPEAQLGAETDAEGRFEIRGVPAGSPKIQISGPKHRRFETVEEIREGQATELVAYLWPRIEGGGFEATVRAEREKKEVARRTLQREEVKSVPGTFGDPVRVIQNLPGLARAPYLGGQLLVRGSQPGDSAVFIDGVAVPLLFHFGGGPSVINPSFVDRIDFFPGAYGARYGRAIGGIVDVATRTPESKRLHGDVDINLMHSGFFLEGPVKEGRPELGNWAVAGRRSYVDLFLPTVMEMLNPAGSTQVVASPRYWDYQARYDVQRGSDRFEVLAFGSDDLLVASVAGTLEAQGFSLNNHQGFHRLHGKWTRRTESGWVLQAAPTAGLAVSDTNFNDEMGVRIGTWDFDFRAAAAKEFSPRFKLELGLDGVANRWDVALDVPALPERQLFPGEDGDLTIQKTEFDGTLASGAVYAEAVWNVLPPLKLVPGLRVDTHRLPRGTTPSVEPRFAARWDVLDGTTIKGAWGLYRQPPPPSNLHPDWGNLELGLEQSQQTAFGFEQKLPRRISLDVQGYFNWRSDLVVDSDRLVERDGKKVPERFRNAGEGRSYGLEVLLKQDITERSYGWIAYTLARAENWSELRQKWLPARYDQTHFLTTVASYKWDGGWETGMRFRLTTGRPDTPVLGATFDADTGGYRRWSGERGTIRGATFHQLDLRVEKTWTYKLWRLSTYLDVQNVYNAENPEMLLWDYRYRTSAPMRGLPFLPTLGVTGAF